MESGYGLDERDFRQLIAGRPYRDRIRRLLRQWGYDVTGFDLEATITDDRGQTIDVAGLHRRIQGDPERQRALYQTAMDLWR